MGQSSAQPVPPDPATLPEAQARFGRFRVGDIECCASSDGAMVRPPRPPSPQAGSGSDAASALPLVMVPLSCTLARVPEPGWC